MQDLPAYFHRVIIHYLLFGFIGSIVRTQSILGWSNPGLKAWFDKHPLMGNRRLATALFLGGFVYANFMAFHEAKEETRAAKRETEQYKAA